MDVDESQRSISKVPRLFHEFVLKCLEIECVSKKCIERGETLPRICFKVCENWRYFKICVSKVSTFFHEFVKMCLEIGGVSKDVYGRCQDSSMNLLQSV